MKSIRHGNRPNTRPVQRATFEGEAGGGSRVIGGFLVAAASAAVEWRWVLTIRVELTSRRLEAAATYSLAAVSTFGAGSWAGGASTTDFMLASPFSNSGPIILSQS